jgi:hypothetical protein
MDVGCVWPDLPFGMCLSRLLMKKSGKIWELINGAEALHSLHVLGGIFVGLVDRGMYKSSLNKLPYFADAFSFKTIMTEVLTRYEIVFAPRRFTESARAL